MKQTTIEQIRNLEYPLVAVPFNGTPTIIKLKELTQAQIYACGGTDFSLIETFEDRINLNKKPTFEQMIKYAEMQHAIAKRSMVCPTYQEVFEICAASSDINKIKNDLKNLDETIAMLPNSPKKTKVKNEYNSLRVWYDLLLPEDFLSTITCYALGIEKSDIKDITTESLINAAIMAKNGNDNPSDHLKGLFTDYMKDDINKRAWILFREKNKEGKK